GGTFEATKASEPREDGTKRSVTQDRVYGTTGGGRLKLQAIGIARNQSDGKPAHGDTLRRFPLGASLGQCCGGVVNLLFEPFAGESPWLDALLALRVERVPSVVV